MKIKFSSDILKSISEQLKILSWASGGINYLGFDAFIGIKKFIIIVVIWFFCQYGSLVLLNLSSKQRRIENND